MIYQNYISGKIPTEISDLPNLITLKLNHNRLKGKIPHFTSTNLVELNLSYNLLDEIHYLHEDYSNLHDDDEYQLEIFDASRNSLKGTIPDGIRVMSHLKILDLSYNKVRELIERTTPDFKM